MNFYEILAFQLKKSAATTQEMICAALRDDVVLYRICEKRWYKCKKYLKI